MGYNISMILVNHPVDEDHRLQFVQKYNRSYQAKREVELESVLYPRNRAFYIGEHNGSTIITNVDVPDRINYEAKWVGEFERKHPITSKLCKSFP
ncbi:MAG: hypothetical protein AAGB22_15460, partial [Bacteroidota bacterium]